MYKISIENTYFYSGQSVAWNVAVEAIFSQDGSNMAAESKKGGKRVTLAPLNLRGGGNQIRTGE